MNILKNTIHSFDLLAIAPTFRSKKQPTVTSIVNGIVSIFIIGILIAIFVSKIIEIANSQ